jgi:hypothetical protein
LNQKLWFDPKTTKNKTKAKHIKLQKNTKNILNKMDQNAKRKMKNTKNIHPKSNNTNTNPDNISWNKKHIKDISQSLNNNKKLNIDDY